MAVFLRGRFDSCPCTALPQQLFDLQNYKFLTWSRNIFWKTFVTEFHMVMLLKQNSDMSIFVETIRFFIEHLLCSAHANFWYLYAFLVLCKEALLCVLSEPSWNLCSKEQLLRQGRRRGAVNFGIPECSKDKKCLGLKYIYNLSLHWNVTKIQLDENAKKYL